MRIPLNWDSPLPVYQQISAHFRAAILTGSCAPGSRLPAVRALARTLGVNRGTVDNAYAALEAEGLLAPRQGSGWYVLRAAAPASQTSSAPSFPAWQHSLSYAGYCELNAYLPEVSRTTDGIALDGGACDPRLFPVHEFRKTLNRVLRRDGISAVEYGEINGYGPLRSILAQILSSQGIAASPERILITAGSQQAIALVSQLLLKPCDAVVVERPTYAGALDIFRALGARIHTVGLDENGMDVTELEEILRSHRPKLIYTIPNFHNPTGTCLNSSRRRHLIDLAGHYDVPILEDDYVGDIRYEGRAQPTLKALDPDGRVIYVSTFSKMLIPGLRIGFILADGPLYHYLLCSKRCHDLATSNLLQRALCEYVSVGRYQAHVQRSCSIYRRRRDAMLAAMEAHLPPSMQWTRPQGGLFVWVSLPPGVSATAIVPTACARGVIVAPSANFYPHEAMPSAINDGHIRLNFASNDAERLTEGIRRLGQALHS